jgi:Cu/Ag efflux protein CusF
MKKKFQFPVIRGMFSLFFLTLAGLMISYSVSAQQGQAVVASTTATATVEKINQKTREVTIKTEDGKLHSFTAGPNVRNLAQVKKGDIITVQYTESLAYEVRKHGGANGVSTATAAARADSGAQPAGAVAQQTTVTVTITAIDKNAPSVTIMGPKGNTKTIAVRDPSKLNGLKVGDLVDITYTEGLAVKVDKPTKAK